MRTMFVGFGVCSWGMTSMIQVELDEIESSCKGQ